MTPKEWGKFLQEYPDAAPYMADRTVEDAKELIRLRRKAFPATHPIRKTTP